MPVKWALDKYGVPEAQAGEALLIGGQQPPVGAGLPAKEPLPEAHKAAHAALLRNAPEQDAIDNLAASMAGDWQQVIQPMTDPLQTALDASHANGETAEQFLARLPALLQSMDPAALTEQLARAAFAARLMGEAGIEL